MVSTYMIRKNADEPMLPMAETKLVVKQKERGQTQWASGLGVMTLPLQGRDRRFNSALAHLLDLQVFFSDQTIIRASFSCGYDESFSRHSDIFSQDVPQYVGACYTWLSSHPDRVHPILFDPHLELQQDRQ